MKHISFSLPGSLLLFFPQLTLLHLMMYKRELLNPIVIVQSFFSTERKALLIFIGSYWPRLNVCYHFQGLSLQDENPFWVSPVVEIKKKKSFKKFFICLSNLSAKVMSPCDRSHSHFTQQPVDYGFEVIRRSDERETAKFFFWLSGK